MSNGIRGKLVFFFAGALAGGIAAILSTPYSGRRMRRVLQRKIDDCSDQFMDATAALRDTGEQIRRQGEKLVRETRKRVVNA